MLTIYSTFRLLSLFALIHAMSGCSWTPRVETPIYEGPQGSVSLITVSEESFEGDHPVTLQTDTIAHVLRGLQVRRSKRLLQKIFSGEANAQQVFTEDQIALLTPPLQKAFSQVTPEEHITFHTQSNHEAGFRSIKGTMYVHDGDLHVTLTFVGQGPHTATKSTGKGALTDQESRGKPSVVFSPKEALRTEKESHWLLGGTEKNRIVINVPLLASLHRQQATPARQTEQERSRPLPASTPNFENTIPKKTDSETSTSSMPRPKPSAPTPGNTGTQALMEEIKALRKELAEQKKAIERLNQEEVRPH